MRYSAVLVLCLNGGCADTEERTMAAPVGASSWFTDITGDVGIDFHHESGADASMLLPPIMGAGAALFDYDGDGDLDVYLVSGGAPPHRGVNRLYRQEGDGRFTDVTEASGLADDGFGMGAAVGDYNNDGHADVYVTNLGPDRLFRNNGDGTFADVTIASGLNVAGWSCSAAFFDADRDGFLDLFVTQYVDFDPQLPCFDRAGRPDYCGPKAFDPVHDVLLHNEAGRRFIDVSRQAGIETLAAAGLGVICDDFNDDGWTDVYVANDAYPNHLWLNLADGTFDESAILMGAAYNVHGKPEAGMGLVASDLDNDALVDLFVTHLSAETNTLYRNLGSGTGWLDVTGETGLGGSSLPFTGFGTAALDVELDGDLDLVVANGRVNRLPALPGAGVDPPLDILAEPNLFYLNDGTGRFRPAGLEAEALCAPIEISRGVATGDIDGDGDLDVLLTNVHGPARLYRNDAPRRGHWLTVRAVDPALKRNAIGARITVRLEDRHLVGTVRRSSSYLSCSDPMAHFGLGEADRVLDIEVRWPDGSQEHFGAAGPDRVVEVVRGEGRSPA